MSKTRRRATRTPGQRLRRRIAVVASLALVLGVVTAAVLAFYIGNRAMIAKDSLEAAQTKLTSFKSALGQQGAPSTTAMYKGLQADTAKAAKQVDDPVWTAAEAIPYAGANLKAFRQTADLVNALVHDGVGPIATAAEGISVESLKPHDGRIDIEPLKRLTPAVADVDDALLAADRSAKAIDTTDVVPQLKQPISSLQGTIHQVQPVTAELRKVMPVLYPALGGDGTRHYLLMFQNNAEERASGGNPASMAMLLVKHGKVSLGKQANSGNFVNFPRQRHAPAGAGADWDKLYGWYTSSFVTNITMTPDFPTTAQLAQHMWKKRLGGPVDGVISFDPVALSYLMKATGPVKLADGQQIDSNNAVQYLLSDVYAKYPDPRMQDAIFGSAAQGIFDAVLDGGAGPQAYLGQLKPMMDEQRLKMWSPREDEEALLVQSGMANMLPADNTAKTVIGVYNNDDATSKMSYYMDEKVRVVPNTCRAVPKYTVSAKVTDTLDPSKIYSLPEYVRAHQPRIALGGDRQWVQVYGPVGSKLVSVQIDGEKVVWGTNVRFNLNTNPSATGADDKRPAVKGNMNGRPVGVVSVKVDAGESSTVRAVFTGGTTPSRTVEVSHTPKVHPVPVTVTPATCH